MQDSARAGDRTSADGVPGAPPSTDTRPPPVAVVSDGTGPPGWTRKRLDQALAGDVAILESAGPIRAVPVVVEPGDPDDLARGLHRLSGTAAALYLTRVEFGRARAAMRHLGTAGGSSVLTEENARAVTLAAATLT
jgi:hypothetical protein